MSVFRPKFFRLSPSLGLALSWLEMITGALGSAQVFLWEVIKSGLCLVVWVVQLLVGVSFLKGNLNVDAYSDQQHLM